MSKDRDINVGSIEKDIENLEKYIELVIDKNYCDCNELNVICYGKYADGSKNVASSIKNILQDYTRQKQINEEHQKVNGELREKVKELEEDLYSANCIIADLTDSIPIQKIQDKIEELDRKIRYEKNERVLIYLHKQKKVLQELLQESEDK